jgi:hypothetical protein
MHFFICIPPLEHLVNTLRFQVHTPIPLSTRPSRPHHDEDLNERADIIRALPRIRPKKSEDVQILVVGAGRVLLMRPRHLTRGPDVDLHVQTRMLLLRKRQD